MRETNVENTFKESFIETIEDFGGTNEMKFGAMKLQRAWKEDAQMHVMIRIRWIQDKVQDDSGQNYR